MNLQAILEHTVSQQYAVGSFSPRYKKMVWPILQAAAQCQSPVIVQISQREMGFYGCTPQEFANTYFQALDEVAPGVPTTLHLDHTKDFSFIQQAIEAGFESVMIDASDKPFEQNAELSRQVAEYAHARGVSVEAELGRIGTTDMVETDSDEEMFTKPDEAEQFVRQTGVDALAVSVGTAHGVYEVRKPRVEYDIIRDIRTRTPVYLVLHGGSGVPSEMVRQAVLMEGGGISKVNIATDLELAFLKALNHKDRESNRWCEALPAEQLQAGQDAVFQTTCEKINDYLLSCGKAWANQ